MRSCLGLALIASLAACGGQPGGPNGQGSVHFVAGRTATDTINTVLAQALVVTVPGAAAGTIIRFDGAPIGQNDPFVLVGKVAADAFDYTAVDTIGADGQALVRVKLGGVIGTAELRIVVPEFGLTDSATYTVLHGRTALVVAAPHDTALLVGGHLTLQIRSLDRASNSIPDTWTVTALDQSTSINGLTVTAAAVGRARVLVRSGATGVTDTALVSVVPDGILSAFGQLGWTLFHPDGTIVASHMVDGGGAFTSDWSPDGQELATDLLGGGGPLRIIALDGTARFPTGSTNAAELYPDYSADGQWIYYARGDTAGFAIHRIHPDGTGDTTMIALTGNDLAPSISPDGQRIAYVINNGTGPTELRLYDIATRTSRQLAPTGHSPSWSPDGTRLAYYFDGDVAVMNADGTGAHKLTHDQRYDLGIDWSPDGKWIVAQRYVGVMDVIDAVTGMNLPLAYTMGWAGPSWKPK